MDLQVFTEQILNFTGTVNFWLVVSLFVMLAISEFGLSIPYLMETLWILVGYHAMTGSLPFFFLAALWVTAMCGRTCGAVVLYHLARFSGSWLIKLYRRIFKSALASREKEEKTFNNPSPAKENLFSRIWQKINSLSPFSVAFGRLIWMRVPLTLTLGFKRQIKVLVPGVMISSMIWDTTYILVGVVGGDANLQPFQIVLCSLSALTVIYGGIFLVRWVKKMIESHKALAGA